MLQNTILKSILTERHKRRLKAIMKHSPVEAAKNILADIRIINVSKKKLDNKSIRVGFVLQMPEIWDKLLPIYETMLEDDNFIPELIVVPPYDTVKKKNSTSYENNYFLLKYPNSIRAFDSGKWIDLKERKYDYIFLQRPYDSYLPKGFRSKDISEFSKVCYIPYGYSGSDIFNDMNTEISFFRNVRLAFLESDHMADQLRKKFKLPIERKIHKIKSFGYPAMLPFYSIPNRNGGEINILWTPRWSFDPIIGGSGFLKYKDAFVQLAGEQKACKYVFRPHPMLRGELQNKYLMTGIEYDAYLDKCLKEGIAYDGGRPLFETLCDTDILITDYSSIIIQFFMTGRPIIYCDSAIKLNSQFKKLAEGFYIAHNEEELSSYVRKLTEGEDPLLSIRQDIISEEYQIHKDSAEKILRCIEEDAKNI